MTTPSPNPDDVTTRLREEDLRAMIDGCEGVTPGPWRYEVQPLGSAIAKGDGCIATAHGSLAIVRTELPHAANAAHIARLDPQTVSAMASELLSLRRQLAERDAGIDMAMGCLDPHSENRDEALAWWRLVDTKAGHQPRSALGEPQ